MITLDKIKIIVPLESIEIFNEDVFQAKIIRDELVELSYPQLTPYNLYIELDYREAEAVIEFTGRILLDRYPQLINRDTIKVCLENINRLGFCHIDIDMVLQYGEVCSIDVTKDVTYKDCKGLCDYLRNNLCNHKRYLAQTIGDNLVIKKNVKTRGCQRTLTIYDKHRELLRADNREFIALCGGSDFIMNFVDKVRFELRLNSKSAIRKDLNITDNSINSILNSEAGPIWEFVDRIIKEDSLADSCLTLNDRKNLALLRECDMDLVRVEAEVKKYISAKTHISQPMAQFRKLSQKLSAPQGSMKETLKGLLLFEIFIIILPAFCL